MRIVASLMLSLLIAGQAIAVTSDGFELPLEESGWQLTQGAIETLPDGNRILRFGGAAVLADRVRLAPGKWYRLACRVRGEGVPAGVARLNLRSGDKDVLTQQIPLASTWETYEIEFYSDASGTDATQLTLAVGEQGTMWLDDCRIGQMPAPDIRFTDRHPAAAAKNLIPNSGFEAGPAGWLTLGHRTGWGPGLSGLYGDIVEEGAWQGTRALRIELGPGKTPVTTFNLFPAAIQAQHAPLAANRGWIEVEKGAVYTLSAYMRADRNGMPVRLMLRFAEPLGARTDLRNDDYVVYPFRMYPRFYRLTREWKRYSFTVRAPERFVFAALGTDLTHESDPAGTVWIDAVQMEKGENVTPYEPHEALEVGWNTGKYGNVFRVGEPVELQVLAANAIAAATRASLAIKVRDFFDRVVLEERRELTLEPQSSGALKWPLRITAPGYYTLETRVGGAGEPRVATLRLAVINDYEGGNSPFGINHAPPDSRVVSQLRKAGFLWIRDWSLNWQSIEPQPGQFDYGVTDRHLGRLANDRVQIMAMLPPWPSSDWASEASSEVEQRWPAHSHIWWRMAYAPRDSSAFRNFVRRTVDHYKGNIRYWEYLNEPLGGYITLPSGPPTDAGYTVENYVALLKVQYEAVKAEDPQAQVIGGLGQETHSANAFFKAGGLSHCDIFNLHIYPALRRPEAFVPGMEQMLKDMDAAGGRKPIWVTEAAYGGTDQLPWMPYALGPMEWQPALLRDERQLAAYSVRFAAIMLAHGVEKIFTHYGGAMNSEVNDAEEVLQSGLLLPGAEPRRLYPAQAALADLLGESPRYAAAMAGTGPTGASQSVYGYAFDGRRGAVLIAWAPEAVGDERRLRVAASKDIRVLDLMGAPLEGRTHALGPTPIYITSRSLSARQLLQAVERR